MAKGQREKVGIKLEQIFKAIENQQGYIEDVQSMFIAALVAQGVPLEEIRTVSTAGLKIVSEHGYEYWLDATYPTIDTKTRDEYLRVMYLQEAHDTLEALYHFLLHFRNELS